MSGTPPTSHPNDFSADDSILGFKYQIRYALYLLIEAQRTNGLDVSIDIEGVDDIDVRFRERITKLVQTKDIATVLTNSSAPLWKTIRIWCTAVQDGTIDLTDLQVFQLIATSDSPEDDAAIVRRLQSGDDRQRGLALQDMRALAAANLGQQTLGRAYRAFHELPRDRQEALVAKIKISTSAPSFDDLDKLIRDQIVHGPPDKRNVFSEVLFGRWDYLVETYLRGGHKTAIGWNALQALLHDIALQFEEDNLPTVFAGLFNEALPSLANDQRRFIRQLHAIGTSEANLQRAQRLYLKASKLLSFWQRNFLVRPDEVSANEKRLIDECQLQHDTAPSLVQLTGATSAQIGQHIYNWALMTAAHQDTCRIRKKCNDPDVVRGCFHALADHPKLGWHPDWNTMFT